MPNTPPSSRMMLSVPAALPTASWLTEPSTEFWADGIAIEMPTPANTIGMTSCQ